MVIVTGFGGMLVLFFFLTVKKQWLTWLNRPNLFKRGPIARDHVSFVPNWLIRLNSRIIRPAKNCATKNTLANRLLEFSCANKRCGIFLPKWCRQRRSWTEKNSLFVRIFFQPRLFLVMDLRGKNNLYTLYPPIHVKVWSYDLSSSSMMFIEFNFYVSLVDAL